MGGGERFVHSCIFLNQQSLEIKDCLIFATSVDQKSEIGYHSFSLQIMTEVDQPVVAPNRDAGENEHDRCCVCFDDLGTESPETGCRKCGNSIHTHCVMKWVASRGRRARCPLCNTLIIEDDDDDDTNNEDENIENNLGEDYLQAIRLHAARLEDRQFFDALARQQRRADQDLWDSDWGTFSFGLGCFAIVLVVVIVLLDYSFPLPKDPYMGFMQPIIRSIRENGTISNSAIETTILALAEDTRPAITNASATSIHKVILRVSNDLTKRFIVFCTAWGWELILLVKKMSILFIGLLFSILPPA